MRRTATLFRLTIVVRTLCVITLTAVCLLLCVRERSLAAGAPPEGVSAPTFSLPLLDGKALSLTQLRGHVVLVNFFATWCPPCRAETPALNAAAKKYASRGVIFVGVDDEESPALVAQFAHVKSVPYPIVLDAQGAVEKTYDVRAIPTTYVLDRNGVIRYRQVDELNVAVLDQALAAVVAGTPLPLSAAAKRFNAIATTATQQIASLVSRPRTAAACTSTEQRLLECNKASLDQAIKTGVDANKKIDALLAAGDSSSINYFDQTQLRDQLDDQLAGAYEKRALLVERLATLSGTAADATGDKEKAALLRGQIFTDKEQFSEAAAQYALAMQLAPKDTNAYDGAYLAAYERRDYAKAAEIATAEAGIAPDAPESWLTVASADNSLKRYHDALAAERKALALASDAYARNPNSQSDAYELGRVWLKMARTQIMARNTHAASALLQQSAAAAPATIVAQQANEQLVALAPTPVAIDRDGLQSARGATASPAHVYVLVRNPSAQSRTINLAASGLPRHWLLSFCYGTVCNPFKVSFALPARGSKRIELLVAPLATTGGPWTMSVNAVGTSRAKVEVDAKTAKAAITVTAS